MDITAPARLSEHELKQVVHAFYAQVRQDPMLGPVFNGAIGDWPAHLDKLTDFWSSVMLASGRYKGQPMPAHIRHAAQITPATFERWLSIWNATTARLLPADKAAALQDKAARIAQSLSLGIELHNPASPRGLRSRQIAAG